MAAYFVEDSPGLLSTIQRERTGEATVIAAHSLRGLAANFGAERVVDSAMRVESTATSPEGRERAIGQLESDLPELLDELRRFLKE